MSATKILMLTVSIVVLIPGTITIHCQTDQSDPPLTTLVVGKID